MPVILFLIGQCRFNIEVPLVSFLFNLPSSGDCWGSLFETAADMKYAGTIISKLTFYSRNQMGLEWGEFLDLPNHLVSAARGQERLKLNQD